MPVSDPPTFAAPSLDWPPPAPNKWRREFEALQRLLPELAPYAGQYVVIHEGQVVDHGADDVALALKFFGRYGNTPVHIGLVSANAEPVARAPHYREVWPAEGSP